MITRASKLPNGIMQAYDEDGLPIATLTGHEASVRQRIMAQSNDSTVFEHASYGDEASKQVPRAKW